MTETETEDLNRPVPLKPFTRRKKSFAANLAEWLGIISAALIAAFLIRTYVLQTFYIPSASMETTLLINDHILANKLAYTYGDIDRGDIVVFRPPPDYQDTTVDHLIKRVVGLPGDTLEARNGEVFVNGVAVNEPYLEPGVITGDLPVTRVPAGSYFMMGDNRSNSSDSRKGLGFVERSQIVGRADLRIWPLDRAGTFE